MGDDEAAWLASLRPVPIGFPVRTFGFVPFQNARELFAEPAMGRPGISRDHHPSFNVADERCWGIR